VTTPSTTPAPRAGRPLARLAVPVALVLALLAPLVLQPASAARLPVSARQITTATAAGCTTTALGAAAAGTAARATQVVLSGVPAACRGKVATLRLYAADGTALAGTDTTVTLAAAASTTVTVPSYATARVAGAAVTIGSWAVPVTWAASAATGPVTPGPGTTFGTVTWSQLASSGTQACVSVPVTGAAGTVWRVDLHLDQRPFNGLTSGSGLQIQSPWWGQVLSTTPVGGVVSVGGRPGSERLAAGETITVTVCHYALPAPVYDPSLPYTQTSTAVTGNIGHACFSTTVGVTGTPQFYAGWRADVDVAPLIAWFAAQGRTVDPGDLTVPGNYALAARGGTVYRVTPTAWDTWGVRDDTTRTFDVCLHS
jgi:hypothetical protein